MVTVLSFIFFTLLVAGIAYYKTKVKEKKQTSSSGAANEYFMAGGTLTCWVIAGSMLLANLSGEQLIGLNGASYASNLSAMAWEATAGLASVVLAVYLLPRYLRGGFTTTPQFLEERFDSGVKRMVSGVFAGSYIFIVIPATLYLGALAFNKVFLVNETLGISYNSAIWVLVWAIGITASLYSIFGGLKLASVANTINALGLLIAGLTVLFLGLYAIGNESVIAGLDNLTRAHPEKLSAIGDGKNGTVPIGGVFTGVLFANMFYWATNQVIIQRCLGAKNLAEGQKGALLTGLCKMLGPIIMMVPGLIAYYYYNDVLGTPLEKSDLAFPSMVRDLLPWWMTGFFMAALFGTVLSVSNSLISAATTLICMDFIKPHRPNISDESLIRSGKIIGGVIAVLTMCIAPMLLYAPDGIYAVLRRFAGFYNISTITVFSIAFLTKKVPPIAPKISIVFHIVTYFFLIFVFDIEKKGDVHFTYVMGTLFFVEIALMLIIGAMFPLKQPYVPKVLEVNERFNEWKYVKAASVCIIAFFIFLYLTFSPFGIANATGPSAMYWPLVIGLLVVTIVLSVVFTKRAKTAALESK